MTKTLLTAALAISLLSTPALAVDGADLAHRTMIVDTHIDVPYRLAEHWEDVSLATSEGDFDYPRAVAGGLNVPFMSIFTPASLEEEGASHQLAHQLIDSMEALAGRAPDKFMIVSTPAEAEAARQAGRLGLAMGMENGSPIAGELANVGLFRNRGISYITLAHSKANHIADSSYDQERPNGGLSDFGRQVVAEMNRTGVMIDVSHVSDQVFWQVLELSTVPVIASHSSARHFTPGFERNMSDEMIEALAARGGVIMINFGSPFLTQAANDWFMVFQAARAAWLEESGFEAGGPEANGFVDDYRATNPLPFATFDEAMAHFWHVIDLVGIEHVGIGSDFDGVGDSLPAGLKDVSGYPSIVVAFKARGFSEQDIAKVLGGNLLRVWAQATDAAKPRGP
jgi:membrane dipeptidase